MTIAASAHTDNSAIETDLKNALRELLEASVEFGSCADDDIDVCFERLLKARDAAYLAIDRAEGR